MVHPSLLIDKEPVWHSQQLESGSCSSSIADVELTMLRISVLEEVCTTSANSSNVYASLSYNSFRTAHRKNTAKTRVAAKCISTSFRPNYINVHEAMSTNCVHMREVLSVHVCIFLLMWYEIRNYNLTNHS